MREAIRAKETGDETVILTALCGHGHFDLAAYDDYLNGRMVDEDVTDERLAAGLATMPKVGSSSEVGLIVRLSDVAGRFRSVPVRRRALNPGA